MLVCDLCIFGDLAIIQWYVLQLIHEFSGGL